MAEPKWWWSRTRWLEWHVDELLKHLKRNCEILNGVLAIQKETIRRQNILIDFLSPAKRENGDADGSIH